jgi:TfoX/Sxy family transcriptional regulator of competence genes
VAAKKKSASPSSQWKPSPEGLVRTFQQAIQSIPEVQAKKMFGYPAAFIDGHLFAGLHQDSMILRLSDDDQATFLKQKGSRVFEPMAGRPMRGFVVVPPSMIESDEHLSKWIARAHSYTKSLPPKPPKTSRKKASS